MHFWRVILAGVCVYSYKWYLIGMRSFYTHVLLLVMLEVVLMLHLSIAYRHCHPVVTIAPFHIVTVILLSLLLHFILSLSSCCHYCSISYCHCHPVVTIALFCIVTATLSSPLNLAYSHSNLIITIIGALLYHLYDVYSSSVSFLITVIQSV